MEKIEFKNYQPDSIILIHSDKLKHNHYLETANIVENKGKLSVGVFSPLSKKFIKKIAELVADDSNKVNYNSLSEKRLISFQILGKSVSITWLFKNRTQHLLFSKEFGVESGVYPVPNLIFRVKDSELSVFAIKSGALTDKTELFTAPFGNISSGKVCMGNVKVKKKSKDMTEMMDSWEKAFFNSYFTHTNEETTVKGNLVSILKSLENKLEFPEDILLTESLTLSDIA